MEFWERVSNVPLDETVQYVIEIKHKWELCEGIEDQEKGTREIVAIVNYSKVMILILVDSCRHVIFQ